VIDERVEWSRGRVSATVHLDRPGIVVLSASYDPGWQVTVDGHRRATEVVAPALVATGVPAGTHTVSFRYAGYGGYPWLFALAVLALLAIATGERLTRRTGSSSRQRLRASPPP
jgi:uncharacterized membrane protein YfhO